MTRKKRNQRLMMMNGVPFTFQDSAEDVVCLRRTRPNTHLDVGEGPSELALLLGG